MTCTISNATAEGEFEVRRCVRCCSWGVASGQNAVAEVERASSGVANRFNMGTNVREPPV